MTKVTLCEGVNEIGGNKILIEDNKISSGNTSYKYRDTTDNLWSWYSVS